MHRVDICIVSYAKNDNLKSVTEKCIESLLNSEEGIEFNTYVVESNKEVSYNAYKGVKTIYPTIPFGYHRYLNLAIKEGKSDHVALCNNDLIFEKGWCSEILKKMQDDKNLLSASPFCPQTQNKKDWYLDIYYGYRVRKEVAGWCIFVKRKIFDIIGPLEEDILYWFSDNFYAHTLQKKGLRHALITNSIVNHHTNAHGKTGEVVLQDPTLREKYTNEQSKIYKQKLNIQ